MKRKENGFAATGILYTILLVFLVLMTTLLATLSSRSRILEKLKKDAKDINEEKYGIPSEEYNQGQTVNYLGYKWLVMKDNGDNTQLVMDGYLSADELKANLPSDISSSEVGSSGKMVMCIKTSSKYCAWYDSDNNYSWNTSIIKPTIENWLNNKMTEKGLDKGLELKGMSFTDGVDTINSYVRIPIYDEVKTLDKYCDEKGPYCADNNDYMFSDYNYWVLTKYDNEDAYFFYLYDTSRGYGGLFPHWIGHADALIRPVITVNEC